MSHITRNLLLCFALAIGGLLPAAVHADGNRGHHQSGIIGRVQVEQVGGALPWQVWVGTDRGESVTVLQTDNDGEFVVNLKPGTYQLQPFCPLTISDGGLPVDVVLIGPPVEVTVVKKDFTVVELPLAWPWPPWSGWELEIQP